MRSLRTLVPIAVVLGVVVLVPVPACGDFRDGDDPGEARDAGGGDGGIDDTGAAADVATADVAPPDGAPPAERVPTVVAGGFRITATEITQRQYQEFLVAVDGTNVAQPAVCAWNASFAPAAGSDCALDANTTPNRPVRCVDWCDAHAFCEWAGLRLCGSIEGGPTPFADFKNPGVSQWQKACGGTANTPYPYGASLNPAACSFALGQSGPPTDVGVMQACEGGYTGVFDMLGNVGEWEDSCDAATGAADSCRIRGGYYTYAADVITCGTGEAPRRDQASAKFGIRCCSK